MKMNRRKRLFLLLFALGLILIAFLLVVLDRGGAVSDGDGVIKDADLTISNFQHTATEKGKILWALKADRADYRKSDKLVGLLVVNIEYFQDDGTKVIATSRKGFANTGTHDLKLMGDVEIVSPEYRVKSEELNYVAESKTFISPGKTFITGEGFDVEADSARYETTSGLLFLSGNVKGALHENP